MDGEQQRSPEIWWLNSIAQKKVAGQNTPPGRWFDHAEPFKSALQKEHRAKIVLGQDFSGFALRGAAPLKPEKSIRTPPH